MPTDTDIVTRHGIHIPASELEWQAIRASGPGGQHVNKSSTAVQLRFDIAGSTALTDEQRARLLADPDRRVAGDGSIVIKAQSHRSQSRNRDDAVRRLIEFIDGGLEQQKPRRPTRPGAAARRKRLDDKSHRGRLKTLRGKVDD